MKAGQLIRLLQTLDPDTDIIVSGREDAYAYDVGDYGECCCQDGITDLGDRQDGATGLPPANCFVLIGD